MQHVFRWMAARRFLLIILLLVFFLSVFTIMNIWPPKVIQQPSVANQPSNVPALSNPTDIALQKSYLENEKLFAEVTKLQREINPGLWDRLWANITVIAGALVGVIGIGRWIADRRDARQKGIDERFQSAVEGLGSEHREARVQAAAILISFLQPGYERFYEQIFNLSTTNLGLQRPDIADILDEHTVEQHRRISQTPLFLALVRLFGESFYRTRNISSERAKTLDASHIYLPFARLTKVDLQGIQMDEAWLQRAQLHGINLHGASLQGANLERANLVKANLVKANLVKANLVKANLVKANLVKANLVKANLVKANLVKANLQGANLERANLVEANLEAANLEAADLFEADFSGANLDGAFLEKANLTGADLEGAFLRGADLEGAILFGADLQRAFLFGADLQRAFLMGANLQRAFLEKANLERAFLMGANLQRAWLSGTSLRGADLRGADLRGANLKKVLHLTQVEIDTAIIDETTELPDLF